MAHPASKKWTAALAGWENAYRLSSGNQIARRRRRDPITLIRRYTGLQAGHSVLEAGCGGGAWGLGLATFRCRVVLSDLSPDALRAAAGNSELVERHFGRLDISYHQGDLFALGFRDGAFDITLNEGVLEHFLDRSDRVEGLREMARVTKPGGCVVTGIPNNCHPLLKFWEMTGWEWTRPGFALQEAIISTQQLEAELTEAGLVDVAVDGYEVYHSLDKHPRYLPLRVLAQVLKNALGTPPQAIRLRWGTYLLAVGRRV